MVIKIFTFSLRERCLLKFYLHKHKKEKLNITAHLQKQVEVFHITIFYIFLGQFFK